MTVAAFVARLDALPQPAPGSEPEREVELSIAYLALPHASPASRPTRTGRSGLALVADVAPWELGEAKRIPARAVTAMVTVSMRCPSTLPDQAGGLAAELDRARDTSCHCGLGSIDRSCRVRDRCRSRAAVGPPWFVRYQMRDGGLNCDDAAYRVTDECRARWSARCRRSRPCCGGLDRAARSSTAEPRSCRARARLGSPTRHNAEERDARRLARADVSSLLLLRCSARASPRSPRGRAVPASAPARDRGGRRLRSRRARRGRPDSRRPALVRRQADADALAVGRVGDAALAGFDLPAARCVEQHRGALRTAHPAVASDARSAARPGRPRPPRGLSTPWDFGPLRYVIATPALPPLAPQRRRPKPPTRTSPACSRSRRLLFGTFYMPKGIEPRVFGVADQLPRGPDGAAGVSVSTGRLT